MLVRKCDKCGREIPMVTKDFFGKQIKVFDTGKITLREWGVDLNRFVTCDLCKPCAHELSVTIDYELLKLKLKTEKI